MTLTNLEKAEHERTTLKAKLTLVEQATLIHATTPIDEADCDIYLARLEPMEAALDDIHMRILNTKPTDADPHSAAYADISVTLVKAQSFLRTLKKSFTPTPPPPAPPSATPHLRLPPINITPFTGRYEHWADFKDLFECLIHNSTTMSDVQKFSILKEKVQDDALSLISNLYVTSANYQAAWATLNERYNNDRELVNTHVKRLFNISSVKSGSAGQIQSLIDSTNECLRALKGLSQPTEHWDTLLIHITLDKLDNESRKQWALSLTGTNVPTFIEFNEFLQRYIRGLQACSVPGPSKANSDKKQSSHIVQSNTSYNPKCVKCNEAHNIYKCNQFLDLSVKDRSAFAKEKNLCFNCLRPASKSHNSENCRSSSCRTCKGKHNTLLHFIRSTPEERNATTASGSKSSNVARQGQDILLSTAIVKTQDITGSFQDCRVVLDNCSQATLISEACVRRLGLGRKWDRTQITGVGGAAAGTSRGKINLVLYSCHNNQSLTVEALILQTVTSDVPTYILQHEWSHLIDLNLADPQFSEPAPVDILLGAEYTAMAMRDGKRETGIESPIALNTMFGWVVTGRVKVKQTHSVRVHIVQAEQLDDSLQKFWEVDNVPKPKFLTYDEKMCEESFVNTYSRDKISGRFCVQLPLKTNINQLGFSREQAVRRWKSVENRLAKNPDHYEQYNKFMQEYIDLGHMTYCQGGEVLGKTYYLPHHFVVKPDSTSTKFRVVFDASARSSTGSSLNDCMYVGATLQSDIFALLLKFRTYQIAIKADIAKMFRQFNVSDDHSDLQRIVWRRSPSEPLQDFKLLTVTYGTASAPFLSTRCLQELAQLNMDNYPSTALKLQTELYVDDLLSGVNTSNQASVFINELNKIADSAQLSFRKWSSNCPEVLESIPAEFRESSLPLSFDKEADVKALGIQWNPKSDTFTFTQPEPCQVRKDGGITKRAVLSQLAKVYDPLGFLSPVTICAKIYMQQLWKCSLGWDEKLSAELQVQWNQYSESVSNINLIKIPRCVNPPSFVKQEIHSFCDASEKAYGAVIYLRSKIGSNHYNIQLLASKSRVAPIKTVSLPRLELCGALLLTKLLQQVMEVLQLNCPNYAWTDSMICLQWLNSHPGRWQTFVANRVAKIQEALPFDNWNHVTSENNPADLVSRGVTAKCLSESKLWWNGPDWLQQEELPPKVIVNKEKLYPNMEEKKLKLISAHTIINSELITRFSSLNRLKRTVAFMFRFVHNCQFQIKGMVMVTSPLSTQELTHAMNCLLVMVQKQSFPTEYEALQGQLPVPAKSKLSSLHPFIDENGVMRVGGRLHKALISAGAKHQIILLGNSHLTKLLISNAHLIHGHGGNKLIWCFLRQQYWIQNARNSIRFELRKCTTCRRHRADKMSQLMGSLPVSRVTPGRVFQHCGVDYAGPINLRVMKGRSNKVFKGYFCIFICMATKAVHLEPVSDLTTEAFISTLHRFVSRRGVPVSIHSDNGTNFKGADRELQKLIQNDNRNRDITDHLSSQSIQWIFNPAAASHQGGIWEAGVKSVKYHLKRIIGESTLTFEEFGTILCQVESYLNSRPLCPLSTDIDDYDALTPGHFIIGQPLTSIPTGDLTQLKVNKLSRWQFTQQVSQHFWKRWHAEYLTTLQQRWKWQRKSNNLSVGDLVIIHEENVPPSKWKLARVIDLHTGHDGLVRVVTVKTRTGMTKRPITKLTPILFISEQT